MLLRGGDLPDSANAYGRLVANRGLSALRRFGRSAGLREAPGCG